MEPCARLVAGRSSDINGNRLRSRSPIIETPSSNAEQWQRHSKSAMHHATQGDPQYEIKSNKTDHIAMHKGR
jgi:hypothetical protein